MLKSPRAFVIAGSVVGATVLLAALLWHWRWLRGERKRAAEWAARRAARPVRAPLARSDAAAGLTPAPDNGGAKNVSSGAATDEADGLEEGWARYQAKSASDVAAAWKLQAREQLALSSPSSRKTESTSDSAAEVESPSMKGDAAVKNTENPHGAPPFDGITVLRSTEDTQLTSGVSMPQSGSESVDSLDGFTITYVRNPSAPLHAMPAVREAADDAAAPRGNLMLHPHPARSPTPSSHRGRRSRKHQQNPPAEGPAVLLVRRGTGGDGDGAVRLGIVPISL